MRSKVEAHREAKEPAVVERQQRRPSPASEDRVGPSSALEVEQLEAPRPRKDGQTKKEVREFSEGVEAIRTAREVPPRQVTRATEEDVEAQTAKTGSLSGRRSASASRSATSQGSSSLPSR